MAGIPELFNPNEFTEKELVKLIYRDLIRLRQDFDEFLKNDNRQKDLEELRVKVLQLEAELKVEKELRAEKEASNKRFMSIAALVFTGIQIAINFLLNYFKH